MKKVLVIGSVNIDHVYTLDKMPLVGETMAAKSSNTFFGGKGANQAVAASIFGADTSFLGAVGEDQYKQSVINNFMDTGVNIGELVIDSSKNTGTAIIYSINGDNSIVIERGANDSINSEFIKSKHGYISSFDIIVVQNEIEDSAIQAVCEIKHDNQVLIYNPAPFRAINSDLLEAIDFITPNETEYQELLSSGLIVPKEKLILTEGANGVTYKDVNYPAVKVSPVDTTGAGDCFNGVLAACLSMDMTIDQAIEWSVKAATKSTLTLGAQNGYRSKADLSK